MFERFTERARQVVVLAQEEARILKHSSIDTEHILLGLVREEQGLAARVLESLDITVERVRAQVVRIVGSGEEVTSREIPFTSHAKRVLELALREAQALGHNYIATEHILLGLMRANGGLTGRILLDFDANPIDVRNELLAALQAGGETAAAASGARAPKEYPDPRHDMTGDAARVLRVALEDTRARGDSLVSVDSLLRALLAADEAPDDRGLRDSLFAGAWPLLGQLVRATEQQLGRRFDAGDLLILLASMPHSHVAVALTELKVDPDALAQAVARARSARPRAEVVRPADLADQIDEVRRAKEAAIEAQEFERAAGCVKRSAN